ncbi:STAS domain-containing protein [Maridesulfovibrio sp.]|uniref:STAS domain-containing protein n=1 Tax=Maridesulfovibrio sp. TaxID=2795000 RepID=UPI0029CA1515|nr:STAS domain-containing protein [Maridesulfovibrio sp.]
MSSSTQNGDGFDFIEEERDECLLLRPKGRFNHSTVPLIRERLYSYCCEYGCRIVMCMEDVDFIDSSGLGVMVHAHKCCEKYCGIIVYSDFSEMISKNMKMLHMDKYLNFCPTLESALEEVSF